MNADVLASLSREQMIDLAFDLPLLSQKEDRHLLNVHVLIISALDYIMGTSLEMIEKRYQFDATYPMPKCDIMWLAWYIVSRFGTKPRNLMVIEAIAWWSYLRVMDLDNREVFNQTHPQHA